MTESIQTNDQSDFFLQTLVSTVNNTDMSIGITLSVGGFLVSGQLKSGKGYFDDCGKKISSLFSKDVDSAGKVEKAIQGIGGSIYDNDGEKDDGKPLFIHLDKVKFFNGNGQQININQGAWWRGRISEVQGFILGELSVE